MKFYIALQPKQWEQDFKKMPITKKIHIILVTRQKMKQTLAKNKKCFTRKLIKPCALPKKSGAKILRGAKIKL